MLALTYSLPEKAEANTATTNKLMTKDTSRAMAVWGRVGNCGFVWLGVCGVNNEG